MKIIKILALFLFLFSLSCSKSSSDEIKDENSIIGFWVLKDFIPDENADLELRTEAELLRDALPSIECNMISLDIRADKSVVMEIFDIEEVFVNANPNAPTYICINPIKLSGTWNFEDDLLTLTGSNGSSDSSIVRFISSGAAYVSSEPFGELGEATTELLFEKLIEIE